MPSTHLSPLSLSLVAVLIAATYLFAAVYSTTLDPDVSGLLSRHGVPPLNSNPPVQAPAIVLAAARAPRGDDVLDRRAQWNPHASWSGNDDENHGGGGGGETYCGAVTKLVVTAEEGPLASDCEAIRAWAADDANYGYFHATMERFNAAPWVRLVSASTCAVAVGTDYHEAYRDGVLVGAGDLAALLGRALGDYAGGERLAWEGDWDHCASPAYRGAGLDAWPARFRIARAENVV